jgi:hypothetical protein
MVKARQSTVTRTPLEWAVRRISLILFEAVELLPASDVGRLTLIGESRSNPSFCLGWLERATGYRSLDPAAT